MQKNKNRFEENLYYVEDPLLNDVIFLNKLSIYR